VEQAVQEVLAADLPVRHELIVVDDGSTYGTGAALERVAEADRVTLLRHERNDGKGAAVRTALSAASESSRRSSTPTSSTTPPTCARCWSVSSRARQRLLGVRAFDGYTSDSFLYVTGNRTVTLAANPLFNVYVRDLMTCHKAIRTDLFRSLDEPGFGIEAEITARLLQSGERIFEVPVHYRARSDERARSSPPRTGCASSAPWCAAGSRAVACPPERTATGRLPGAGSGPRRCPRSRRPPPREPR